ncbi:hypothetical protein AGIG_G16630 [Arapaima gigas]
MVFSVPSVALAAACKSLDQASCVKKLVQMVVFLLQGVKALLWICSSVVTGMISWIFSVICGMISVVLLLIYWVLVLLWNLLYVCAVIISCGAVLVSVQLTAPSPRTF